MSQPAARILINGRDVTSQLLGKNGLLTSLTFTDNAGHKADTLEIELDNRDDMPGPPPGTPIQLWLGYAPTPIYKGSFKVDQWTKRGGSSGRSLHVSAKAADLTTDIRQVRARSHHGKTILQIAQEIAGRHNLGLVVDSEVGSRVIDHIDQQHESDLHFLTRLAHRNGATFKLGDGKIVIAKKGSTKLPSGAARPQMALKPTDVDSWTATSAHRGDYKSVIAYYGDKHHNRRGRTISGSGTPQHRLRVLYATKNEAHRASFAAQRDLKRGMANFETEGPGLPTAFSEMLVSASGFSSDVDGTYVIKTATHVFENRGYRTTLTMETLGTPTDGETDTSDGDPEATP